MYALYRGNWYRVDNYKTIDGITYYTLNGVGTVPHDAIETLDFD